MDTRGHGVSNTLIECRSQLLPVDGPWVGPIADELVLVGVPSYGVVGVYPDRVGSPDADGTVFVHPLAFWLAFVGAGCDAGRVFDKDHVTLP